MADIWQRPLNGFKPFSKSIKIGLERSINIDDFPLIRVVPNDNELDTFDG
ncbi:hypothetical protein [Campylobacter ureolyticus]|nr:hypothetical protein [Campylobacter ureolyticus]MCR8685179.1 hypothetical protein [Campylobacter ureolyticus]QQY35193.1 hypothetical protein I6I59_06640 [Campylobacter ureolyticus]